MVVMGLSDNGISVPIKTDDAGKLVLSSSFLPMPYPVPKSARYANTALPAGSSINTVITVPANEYWRLSLVSVFYTGTVAGVFLVPLIYNGSTFLRMNYHYPILSGQNYLTQCNVLLAPNWTVSVSANGATLNDDITIDAFAEHVFTI